MPPAPFFLLASGRTVALPRGSGLARTRRGLGALVRDRGAGIRCTRPRSARRRLRAPPDRQGRRLPPRPPEALRRKLRPRAQDRPPAGQPLRAGRSAGRSRRQRHRPRAPPRAPSRSAAEAALRCSSPSARQRSTSPAAWSRAAEAPSTAFSSCGNCLLRSARRLARISRSAAAAPDAGRDETVPAPQYGHRE